MIHPSMCANAEELMERVGMGPVLRRTGLYVCRPDPDDAQCIPYDRLPQACAKCKHFRPLPGQTTLEAWE